MSIYRTECRKSLKRARSILDDGSDEELRYAVLELRMAMEALTYDRIKAYKDEIPPDEYATWQPIKILDLLLEIDPTADKEVTISVGIEEEYGKTPEKMETLGTDQPLSLSMLKKHYNALGSYLHIPTIKQFLEGNVHIPLKIRERCEQIAGLIENSLNSGVFNVTLGDHAQTDCKRCGKSIRKRIPPGTTEKSVVCLNCSAPYTLKDVGKGKVQWIPTQDEVHCPTEDCKGEVWFWADEVHVGREWKCKNCEVDFELGLGIFKSE